MRRKKWKLRLWTRWGRWILAGVGVLVLLLVVDAIAGRDIKVWWTLRDLDSDPAAAEREIQELGLPYRSALRRSLTAGGREFPEQLHLAMILVGNPFFSRDAVLESLESDDPVVRRAAAVALLRASGASPAGLAPDQVVEIFDTWSDDVTEPWLANAIGEFSRYRDDRLAEILIKLVLMESKGETLLDIGRANKNRSTAAHRLAPYAKKPEAAEALLTVAAREKEADMVKTRAWQALAAGGYAADPELYWKAARSDSALTRQVVADNLEAVSDPRVAPILHHLLADQVQVVRRGALNSLMRRRDRILIDDLYYLAEDSFTSMRGDLAQAVGGYRDRDHLPFIVWCLDDVDSVVVEKAFVELIRMTRKHHGFSDAEWEQYRRTGTFERIDMVKAFMNDEERKAKAFDAWEQELGARYREKDRTPHLIRQLAHADRQNVRRAIKELAMVTGRSEGLPEEVLTPGTEVQVEDDALSRFIHEEREAVIAEWYEWLRKQED